MASAAPRGAIVLGKIFAGVCLGWLQGVLMLLLLPLTNYTFSPWALLQASGVLFITALNLGGLGFVFAWRMDSVQGFHSVMGMLLFPMWLVSGAFFPAYSAEPWVQVVMMLNPLHYGLVALRSVLYAAEETAILALSFHRIGGGAILFCWVRLVYVTLGGEAASELRVFLACHLCVSLQRFYACKNQLALPLSKYVLLAILARAIQHILRLLWRDKASFLGRSF